MFDYDGVLVDSLDVFTTTFVEACQACGYAGFQTRDQLMDLLDGNFYEAMTALGLSDQRIEAIIDEAYRREIKTHARRVTFFPGLPALLKSLEKDNVLTVITSNYAGIVKQVFEKENITCFQQVLGGDTEKSKVKKIQSTMARFPSLPAYYIGDTVGDIIEGKQAGATTVAVTWGWHNAEKLRRAAPDYLVDRPKDLAGLIS